MTITKTLRVRVWNTYIGQKNGTFECLCGGTVSQLNFEVAHVIPRSKGGLDTVENLRPLCSSCNRSMGTKNLNQFILNMGMQPQDYYAIDIDTYSDEDEDLTERQQMQKWAMSVGIKAAGEGMTTEKLKELQAQYNNGEEIAPEYYRKDVRQSMLSQATDVLKENPGKSAGGAGVIVAIVIMVIIFSS